jgi:hypothetical protein
LIVLGKVLAVRPGPESGALTATVDVSKAWKRRAPGQIEVVTDSNCAYEFAPGREDLLFLQTAPAGFGTNRCLGNEPAANAKKMLDWLKRHARESR